MCAWAVIFAQRRARAFFFFALSVTRFGARVCAPLGAKTCVVTRRDAQRDFWFWFWFCAETRGTPPAAFDKVGKEIEKWMKQDNVREFPQPYVGTVIAVHAFLTAEAADKQALKSLSKTESKAFTVLAQKVKKMVKDMESAIKKYESVRDFSRTFLFSILALQAL